MKLIFLSLIRHVQAILSTTDLQTIQEYNEEMSFSVPEQLDSNYNIEKCQENLQKRKLDVQSIEKSELNVQSIDESALDVQTIEESELDVQTIEKSHLDVQSIEKSTFDVQSTEESALDVQKIEKSELDVQSIENSLKIEIKDTTASMLGALFPMEDSDAIDDIDKSLKQATISNDKSHKEGKILFNFEKVCIDVFKAI